MKQQKTKKMIAWIILIILISFASTLTYLKFFSNDNENIEERPINNSSSNAIHAALKDIVTNFNQNSKIEEYQENNITLKASVNNYSIYISYITNTTTTYEFTYDDLYLNITVNNTNEDDKAKFNTIYQLLIEAVQKRINNTDDVYNIINTFLTTDATVDGLSKKEVRNGIEYQMNITKKIKQN